MLKPQRVVDLCCGAGLFSAGMERAGHRIILGVDNNPIVLDSFQTNFPDASVLEGDLMDLKHLPRCDVIIGGPSCQPFSMANRNRNPETGMALVEKFLDLVKNANPKYWIMEEVPPVADHIRGRVPRVEVWDCSSFGARNLRPRMFAGDFPDPVTTRPACESPAPTVLASDMVTPIPELRDLQGIPSWFVLCGTERDQRQQIGNGVPLETGEAFGRGIGYHLQGRGIGGHQEWHTMGAAYYRQIGIPGKRAYLSCRKYRYCYHCDAYFPEDSG